MDRLETELQHLLNLISPPSFPAWLEYAEWKARVLAQKYPQEFASLPMLLSRDVSAQRQNSTSSEKPSEQPGTGEPGPKPADTPMTRPRASTGRLPTSSLAG